MNEKKRHISSQNWKEVESDKKGRSLHVTSTHKIGKMKSAGTVTIIIIYADGFMHGTGYNPLATERTLCAHSMPIVRFDVFKS